jgi:hypothetical protein
MPLNVGGGTIGAANSQQKTDTDTFAIIRTGAWVSGIMNPTTASICKGGRTKRSRTLETIENRRRPDGLERIPIMLQHALHERRIWRHFGGQPSHELTDAAAKRIPETESTAKTPLAPLGNPDSIPTETALALGRRRSARDGVAR